MSTLISKAWGWLVGVAVVLGAFAAAYFKGRAGGRQDERRETESRLNQQGAAAREKVRDVEQKTDSLDDIAVRNVADEWVQRDASGKVRD